MGQLKRGPSSRIRSFAGRLLRDLLKTLISNVRIESSGGRKLSKGVSKQCPKIRHFNFPSSAKSTGLLKFLPNARYVREDGKSIFWLKSSPKIRVRKEGGKGGGFRL